MISSEQSVSATQRNLLQLLARPGPAWPAPRPVRSRASPSSRPPPSLTRPLSSAKECPPTGGTATTRAFELKPEAAHHWQPIIWKPTAQRPSSPDTKLQRVRERQRQRQPRTCRPAWSCIGRFGREARDSRSERNTCCSRAAFAVCFKQSDVRARERAFGQLSMGLMG